MGEFVKHRGKTIKSREWVYGIHTCRGFTPDEQDHYIRVGNKTFKVWPKSVGLYTERKDLNGKEIYEGDILRGYCYGNFNTGIDKDCDCIVKYNSDEHRFILDAYAVYDLYMTDDDSNYLTVVGNKFDNPELDPYYGIEDKS